MAASKIRIRAIRISREKQKISSPRASRIKVAKAARVVRARRAAHHRPRSEWGKPGKCAASGAAMAGSAVSSPAASGAAGQADHPGPGPRAADQGDTQANPATANGKNPGSPTGDNKSNSELNPIADLNKQDVWGHLPESMRAAMNAYAGRQETMAKHEKR